MALHLISCVRAKAKSPPLTAEELRRIMRYDPETGLFHRYAKFTGGRSKVGGLSGNGYIKICVHYRQHYAHILAWLYMTGEYPEPPLEIDHLNGIRTDNRWSNLRIGTRQQNGWNRGKLSNNTSGFLCVFWHPNAQRWWARVGEKSLGLFDTREEAYVAVKEYMIATRGEFAPREFLPSGTASDSIDDHASAGLGTDELESGES